ncbi:hypothetical protein M0804_014120, partial [Polistes exclamans]
FLSEQATTASFRTSLCILECGVSLGYKQLKPTIGKDGTWKILRPTLDSISRRIMTSKKTYQFVPVHRLMLNVPHNRLFAWNPSLDSEIRRLFPDFVANQRYESHEIAVT